LQSVPVTSLADQAGGISQKVFNPVDWPAVCSSLFGSARSVLPHFHEHFEDPDIFFNHEPRCTKWAFCCGEVAELTTDFRRAHLVSFLSAKVSLLGPTPIAKLIKCVGDNKSKVFTTPTPGHKLHQGVVHALVLQLITAGVPSVCVADETKEGTDRQLLNEFVLVNWATVVDSVWWRLISCSHGQFVVEFF
jgi:hypothetical protein